MDSQILSIDAPLWPQTLQSLRHDIYHTPAYVALEAEHSRSVPEAFIARNQAEIFFAVYVKRSCASIMGGESGESSESRNAPFDVVSPYGYPGILLSPEAQQNPDFINAALVAFQQLLTADGICAAFIRLHPILGAAFNPQLPQGTVTYHGPTVSVDLTLSEATLWAQTRRGHQSTINRCIRLGQTARMIAFSDCFDDFLAIYAETMGRVQAQQSYFFDTHYFKSLLNLGDQLQVCIVEQESHIVAACLFFECCGIVQAHLGGTLTAYLNQSPFTLLLHHVRLWAKRRGNSLLHLGGGVGAAKDDKLFRFKSGFSKSRQDFYTLRWILDAAVYQSLIEQRAIELQVSPAMLAQSKFFPAYRTPELPGQTA